MPIRGFSHYNLCAPRPLLDELRAFYCDVVGLEVGPRPAFARFGYWLYAGRHDVLHLIEPAVGDVRTLNASSMFDHVAFACVDRRAYERVLDERGIDYRVAHVPGTGQVQLMLRDPAGHGVELGFEPDDAQPA